MSQVAQIQQEVLYQHKMGEIIIPNAVVRKPNYLYYVDSQGNVCEAQLSRNGRKKKVKLLEEKDGN